MANKGIRPPKSITVTQMRAVDDMDRKFKYYKKQIIDYMNTKPGLQTSYENVIIPAFSSDKIYIIQIEGSFNTRQTSMSYEEFNNIVDKEFERLGYNMRSS